jgi:hypothetical protein
MNWGCDDFVSILAHSPLAGRDRVGMRTHPMDVMLSSRLCKNSDGVQGMMSKFHLNRAKHDCDFSFWSFRYLIFD